MRLLLVFSVVVAVTMAKGCTEAVNESNYEVIANYSAKPRCGKYANGTTVTLTCKVRGFFVTNGSDEATCVDGKWIPNEGTKLGRCPYMCRLSHLKKKGFITMWVDDAPDTQDWFKHGTPAYAYCCSLYDIPIVEPPNMMCLDGKWIQSRGKPDCFKRG